MVKKGVRPISEAFRKLDPEKQRQILDAVLREFAEHGYAKASTNRMVQQAGISKGLLFYYFKNKEELFRCALEYSLDYLHKAYVSKLDFTESDFLLRMVKITKLKMQAYLANPLPFTLLASLQIHQDAREVVPDVHKRIEDMTAGELGKLFANVDTSLFRDDVPPEQVMNLIRWSLEGYRSEFVTYLKDKNLMELDWQFYEKEFYGFLDVLRKILYKEVRHGDSSGK